MGCKINPYRELLEDKNLISPTGYSIVPSGLTEFSFKDLMEDTIKPNKFNGMMIIIDYTKMTEQELILEAKNRGLVAGAKVTHLTDGSIQKISENGSYCKYGNSFYAGSGGGEGIRIFHNNKWTEVVKPAKWWEKVEVGDTLRCVGSDGEYAGSGWRSGLEFKVGYIERTGDEYIFGRIDQGGGVYHYSVEPVKCKNINKVSINKNNKKNGKTRSKTGSACKIQRSCIGLERGERPSGNKLEIGRPIGTVRGEYKGNKTPSY